MSGPIGTGEARSYSLKPGDHMHFLNQQPNPIRVRVTTDCGTVTEADLHPGAVFRLTAGALPAKIEILPPVEPYSGMHAVD